MKDGHWGDNVLIHYSDGDTQSWTEVRSLYFEEGQYVIVLGNRDKLMIPSTSVKFVEILTKNSE